MEDIKSGKADNPFGGMGGGMDPSDIFRMFAGSGGMGGGNPFGGMGGMGGRGGNQGFTFHF